MSAKSQAIFLSYASQDAEAGLRICDALRSAGCEVWFDQSELRGGDAWDASIRHQIRECALFVPVISANTQARSEGYFRLEWKLAVDRSYLMADDQPFLLPVVIDDTSDASARVPDRFRERQWSRLMDGETLAAFAKLVGGLLSVGALPSSAALARAGQKATPAATTSPQPPPSIAVLPFVNRSHDEENEYFSDGLADELLNVLAKIRGLRVVARSSAFTFKGKGATVAEVGRALNVGTVLEGSVRKSGNRLRIAVQLVNVADGYHLWSESYDRTVDDIFAVQDDIAQSVVRELRGTLLGAVEDTTVTAQVADAVKGRAADPEAHRLYLQARYLIDRSIREDTMKGIGHLRQALDRDPDFALAWVELSVAFMVTANHGWAPVSEGYRQAREAAAHALSLEPDLAEGHGALSAIQTLHDWEWRGAEASLRRALDLAPGNVNVLRRAARLDLCLGRLDEAIGRYRKALEQDPLSAGTYHVLGLALDAAGRLAEAEFAYRKSLDLAPQCAASRAMLALIMCAQGRLKEALAEAQQEPEELARLYALAIVHQVAGNLTEADAALRELIGKQADSAAYQVAQVYAVRRENDLAFDWIERAYVQRDPGLSEMKACPRLRILHSDPRWGAFLRKMRLDGQDQDG